MPTENLTLDMAFLEFLKECDTVLGEDWVNEAKAALASCTEEARTALQAQLLPFLLAAAMYWLSDKRESYWSGSCSDPLRMVLERVRACLRDNAGLRQKCRDLIAERDRERTATVESLRQLSSKLETAKAQLEKIANTPLAGQSGEQTVMPSLSDESLQGLGKAELRQKCIKLSDQLNINMLHYGTLAEEHRLLVVAYAELEAQRKQAVADRAVMSCSLTQALHRADVVGEDYAKLSTQYAKAMTRLFAFENQRDWLLDALGALEEPDGVIRGPLLDGPELDALNVVIANIRKIEPGDKPRDGSTTIHVPPGAEAYVWIYEDGEEGAPAPYERDKVVVAAERLLNVTGEQGLALESKISAAMTSDESLERGARHALYDAIMHTKTIGPDGPYDPGEGEAGSASGSKAAVTLH